VCVFLCWIARAGDPLAVVPHNVELGLLDGAERCAGLKSHTCSIATVFSSHFRCFFLYIYLFQHSSEALCRMLLRLNQGLLIVGIYQSALRFSLCLIDQATVYKELELKHVFNNL
jgi:hypothetical protein